MTTKSKVFIVHCVDTEGPLYESIEETFARIHSIFGVNIECTRENLIKLQSGRIDLNGIEDKVKNLVSRKRISTNETWDDIDKMLDNILSNDFRNSFLDSYGNGWVYSWFCLDHVGFSGLNPRRRDSTHHSVFDFYKRRLCETSKDTIQWHYHPIPVNGNFHSSGITYLNSSNLWEIISRKIIDRFWFPSVYRPGFHAERPDSNWFLEQWIPFDFGNQSTLTHNTSNAQPDLVDGRWGDWRRAPKFWRPYNPSHDDYQVEGSCRRYIFRCLNMEARLREISHKDFYQGFEEAKINGKSCIAFTNHDFRDMTSDILKMQNMIEKVSKDFPDVDFVFTDALTAAQEMVNSDLEAPNLDIEFNNLGNNSVKLIVQCQGKIFGPQPYLAIKTKGGKYLWENFDFLKDNVWTYIFDEFNSNIDLVEKVGIAANSPSGISEVRVFEIVNSELIFEIS